MSQPGLTQSSPCPGGPIEPSSPCPAGTIEPTFPCPAGTIEPTFPCPGGTIEPTFPCPAGPIEPTFPCPGGTIENSPAFQRWVRAATAISPEGTAEAALLSPPSGTNLFKSGWPRRTALQAQPLMSW